MGSVSRIGMALSLMIWLFLPAVVVGSGGERTAPRRGELNRLSSTDGEADEPTRMPGGIETTVETFAERRGLQPRLDDDGSADALKKKKKKKNDEGSDESGDNPGNPDEDEDGDVTPSAP